MLLNFLLLLTWCVLPVYGFASSAYISGVVVNTKGTPVNNAVVGLQGGLNSTRTDQKGHFQLVMNGFYSSRITAGKFGYYNGATPLSSNVDEYRIVLNPIPKGDNEHYDWLPSLITQQEGDADNAGEGKACQVCHPAVTEEWKQDAHSDSARNTIFLSFFNGTDKNGKQEGGPGYKQDFPKSTGNCATCHVPVLALQNLSHADPNRVDGTAKEGIFCDFCHKISGVTVDETGGKPGVLSIEFQRPPEGHQLFFGPYSDVFPGEDGINPLYSKSYYCAPCHNGKFWDVLAYSEFQEWAESFYKAKNIHCQNCHMPREETMTHFASEDKGGVSRVPNTIPSHINLGVRNETFMKEAIKLQIQAQKNKDCVEITSILKNVKAGHHYPTGNPMRNMILLVDVRDANDKSLPMFQGDKVPVWGGVGSIQDGNYAGQPGKGFAKVLRDAILYPDRKQRHFSYEYPAPHWRPTYIESDNRIPADCADVSSYRFQVTKNTSYPIHVTVNLIYRRTYKAWMDEKNLEIPDLEIAKETVVLRR
jgi:ferredoxin